MMMCSICKENLAVVFITKIINGKQTQEGLCFSCAKKQGIQPINQILEQTGISEEEIDDLKKQMETFFEDMDFSGTSDPEGGTATANPFFNLINKSLNKTRESMGFKSSKDETESDGKTDREVKDDKNNTRTKTQDKKMPKKKKYLDTYGTNLIVKAKEGKIDRVIGRNREIERVIQILNRRNKNNPVLIGEPGVGKTAIAEGLALRIVNRDVPVKLFNAEVYVLDLTSIVAGTQFRGQFENRMKGIIEECKALGNIILVIDEIHNIMGAGEAEGAMNAANILKPALAKGEIQVIGATTLDEYRKHIEKDSALREWEYEIFKGRVIDISFDRDGKSQTIRAKLMGRENENVVIEYEGNYFRIPFDQVRKAKLVFDEGGKEHGKKQKRSHRKGT